MGGKNGERQVWPDRHAAVTSAAQNDKLSSHQCVRLPDSEVSAGRSLCAFFLEPLPR